tara:strand:- start:128 stop:1276 length:1149 start_codon:yes stop_codon:yes gene_type:complete
MCDSNEKSSIKSNSSVKKKRGRKPKNKPLEEEVKIPKKRGRKPKNILKDLTDQEKKVPKKRGRKPNGKIISLENSDKKDSITIDDCIITHLPIKMSDLIAEKENENEITEDIIDDTATEIIDDEDESISELSNNIFIKNKKQDKTDVRNMDKHELIEFYNNKIKELEAKYKSNTMIGKKIYETEVKFDYIDESKCKKWKESTNIHCWWCCHSFDTPPVSIPEKIFDKTYHVFGCFCSFNCAYSYNININDYKIWERLSMLKSLYNKMYKDDKDILPAPPRKALSMFGGHLSIDEFRNNNIFHKNEYLYLIPPMVSIIPMIEENNIDSDIKGQNKFVPINSMKNLRLAEKLKRNKPVNNTKYSLVKTMGLKKKTKKEKDEFFI